MWRTVMAIFGVALTVGAPVSAAVTFQIMGPGYATSVSADGSVIVGFTPNLGDSWRWTIATGMQPLGFSACSNGLGCGGSVSVSWDGRRVSSTIVNPDTSLAVPGVWTLGQGWTRLMPPSPPTSAPLGGSLGTAWGISGDGTEVVGLYWRNGQPDGVAHAVSCIGSVSTDLVGMGHDSRANGSNYDGSVVAGWAANPSFHNWWPCVWVNGSIHVFDAPPNGGFAEAKAVNASGTVVVGSIFDSAAGNQVAARWQWNGSSWNFLRIGMLPGSFAGSADVIANGVTADGNTVVGYNAFSAPIDETGFLWTPTDGMLDIEEYLALNNVSVPSNFNIRTIAAISADGSTLVGSGQDVFPPFATSWFMIKRPPVSLAVGPTPSAGLALAISPNPVREGARVQFELPTASDVSITLLDIAGRTVRQLADGAFGSGRHVISVNGRDDRGGPLAPGVYLVRLRVGSETVDRTMVLLR